VSKRGGEVNECEKEDDHCGLSESSKHLVLPQDEVRDETRDKQMNGSLEVEAEPDEGESNGEVEKMFEGGDVGKESEALAENKGRENTDEVAQTVLGEARGGRGGLPVNHRRAEKEGGRRAVLRVVLRCVCFCFLLLRSGKTT